MRNALPGSSWKEFLCLCICSAPRHCWYVGGPVPVPPGVSRKTWRLQGEPGFGFPLVHDMSMICTSFDSQPPFIPWRFASEADDFEKKLTVLVYGLSEWTKGLFKTVVFVLNSPKCFVLFVEFMWLPRLFSFNPNLWNPHSQVDSPPFLEGSWPNSLMKIYTKTV